MSRNFVDLSILPERCEATVAIAVPARNEAGSIEGSLRALDTAAAHAFGTTVHVVILVNNSSDDTATIARAYQPHSIRVTVVEVDLPLGRAHAGGARRAAFDHAEALLPPDGILMTTDADSCVDPNWIVANLAEIDAGADAVAGVVAFDEAAHLALPPMPFRALEWQLAALHARLGTLVDPRAHDPWPNHIWAWGASLAVTVGAYRRVGGLPSIPLAEDRALADALERADLRVRRSHAPVVFTSARRQGRAPGGFADLIESYARNAEAPCDAALEPTSALFRRLRWRARLRKTAVQRGMSAAIEEASRLGYQQTGATGFGQLWAEVEAQSPTLARVRVDPARLAIEVARAQRLIERLEQRVTGRGDIRVSVPA